MTANLEDNGSDIASTAQPLEPPDISTDSLKVAELTTPLPPAPKTAFLARLSQTPELPGQSCREVTQAGQGKLRHLEPRERPGQHDVDFGWHRGTGHPLQFTPLE